LAQETVAVTAVLVRLVYLL